MEEDIVGVEDHVLHQHVRVALEDGIRRQVASINLHHHLPIDRDMGRLTPFRPPFRRVSFLFRGVVLGRRWGRVGFDGGLALLPLEPGDLVAEALDLRLGCLEVRHDVFEPVAQLLHEVARSVIRDAVQVKVFKHVALGSSTGKLHGSSAIMPAFAAPGNPARHVISSPPIIEEIHVEGYFTSKVSANVYDTATGRHLLVPQGSTILGHDQSQHLLYGNERLPTVRLTLALPDGRSVDLGHAPITDQQGVAGLTGDVNNHWWRLFGAIFIGGALRGGVQALQTATAQAAGAGQVAAGYGSVVNQAMSPRLGRALDTRPTITVDAGQICNILLTKELRLPA